MASLSAQERSRWKAAVWNCGSPWVACGISLDQASSGDLSGMAGLVDWIVHGQVSRLLLDEKLRPGECCLIPGDQEKGRPNFLLFPVDRTLPPQVLAEKARKLQIEELALAETTIPEDFLSKVKQTFKKEGIRWKKLEPQTE